MGKANSMNKQALGTLADRLHLPGPKIASHGVLVGLLLARKYTRLPTYKTLTADLGISAATAHRWLAAMKAAGWRRS